LTPNPGPAQGVDETRGIYPSIRPTGRGVVATVRHIPVSLRHLRSRSAVGLVLVVVASVASPGVAVAQVGPPGVEPRDGTATFTDLTGPGACSFLGEPPDNLHVGLSTFEYGTAIDCGGYLDVTGPSGTVRVKVTDHCRNCDPGLIDVTRTAFAGIADVAAGRVPVSYRLVRNPPLAEAISLRVKSGSSRWWLQIQALDHGNPIARFEALQDGAWRRLVHTGDNFWTAEDPGLGDGPFSVRITDVFDQQVVIDQVDLAPGVVQPTAARLYPAPGETTLPSPPTTGAPTHRGTTTTVDPLNPNGLPPPLSILPPSAPTDDDDDGDGVATAAGSSDAGDRGGPPNGAAPIWPMFLVLVSAAALAGAVARHRVPARRHAS
jgi:expansin (peptidoglycan-binding protein)